jgi:hypothetical protein
VRRRVRRARARPFAARRGVGSTGGRRSLGCRTARIGNDDRYVTAGSRRIVTSRLARKDTDTSSGTVPFKVSALF